MTVRNSDRGARCPGGRKRFGIVAAVVLLAASSPTWAADAERTVRERLPFGDGWRFQRNDPPGVSGLAYEAIRAYVLPTGDELLSAPGPRPPRPAGNPGGDVAYVQPEFDDSAWRKVTVPHDWGIEGPFRQELSGETGKLPWAGVGWYRKRFTLPAADEGRQIQLDVDGAMAYSAVWVNGQFVGGWPYGYTSYRLDLTPHVHAGRENVVVVRLDNPPDSSRWYPGSGLYRNVWLVKTGPVRVAHWGVFVTTPRITAESAVVDVDVVLENLTAEKTALQLTTRVFELDATGRRGPEPVAASEPDRFDIDPARARQARRANLVTVPRPSLWDLDGQHLLVHVNSRDPVRHRSLLGRAESVPRRISQGRGLSSVPCGTRRRPIIRSITHAPDQTVARPRRLHWLTSISPLSALF